MKHRQLSWLITIVDRDKGNIVAEIYNHHHIGVQLIALGKGTAGSEIMDYLGLDQLEKDLILSLVPSTLAGNILSHLNETLHFSKPGKGIAFSIPLSGLSVGMSRRLEEVSGESMTTENEEASIAMENLTHDLIVAVVNHGESDIVMKAAKEAGARGGTIAKAREAGEEAKKVFGFMIQPEKELVLILVPNQDKQPIMQAICTAFRKEIGEALMAFSLPVDGVTGILGD